LGDGLETSLTVPAGFLGGTLGFRERRIDAALAKLTKEEVVQFLSSVHYGSCEGASSEEEQARRQYYNGFIVCAYGSYPPFDDVFAALVGLPSGERFIWQKRGSPEVREVLLAPGEFDATVRGFLDWLESETGWKLEGREWLELTEAEREEARHLVLRRKPSLARPVKRALLEAEAAKDWASRHRKPSLPVRA